MIGEQVGNYIIEGKLGAGGMGAVYRARHVTLGRPAAVKVLLPQFSATPDIVQRFFNEAKAATSIRHLGIIEIYDFGLMNNGVAFIAMELLRGESLCSRMRRRRMAPEAYLSMIRQMCGALAAAHDLGIVHRDLKPDNVFLVPDGEVATGERIKLLDFGIAKLSQESSGIASQTRTGSVMGTPAYMAPEQCRGVKVDHRADIYSLGCILFEMVSGRPPFGGEGLGDILAAHIYAKHEPVETLAPGTPPAVARLIDRLLAKDPAERPQTTRELIREIDGVASTVAQPVPLPLGVVVPPVMGVSTRSSGAAAGTGPAPARPARRRLMIGLAGVLATAGIGSAIVKTTSSGEIAEATAKVDGGSTAGSNHAAVAAVPPPVPAVIDASVIVESPATTDTVDVDVDSIPASAHVWLDGKDLGTAPYRGTIPRSDATLQLVVRHPGFDDFHRVVHPSSNIAEFARLKSSGTGANGGPAIRAGSVTERMSVRPHVAPPAQTTPHTTLTDDDTLPPTHGHGSAR